MIGAENMSDITIYTGMLCGFCSAAKRLLKQKGAEFTEIDVTFNPAKRSEMSQLAGGLSSVPQIFIGKTHVGGCDDLYALEQAGKLDGLLNQ
jgi:glutaredoxin 3